MDRRLGHGAVQAQPRAGLDLGLFGAGQQTAIDPLPGLGADRADRLLQDRLLRAPMQRQPGKGLKGGRVRQVKGQFLVTQLPVLLEQGAAQDRLGREPVAPGLLAAGAAYLGGHQGDHLAMLVQPRGHGLELATDLVLGEEIEYTGLDDAVFAHCRLRRLRGLVWIQWLASQAYPKPPEISSKKYRFSK